MLARKSARDFSPLSTSLLSKIGRDFFKHCGASNFDAAAMMISLTTILFALASSSRVVGAFVIYPTFTSLSSYSSFNMNIIDKTIGYYKYNRRRLPPQLSLRKMMMATTDTNSVNANEEHNTDENNTININSNNDNINSDDRKIRIQKEMEICNTLKVKELKVELESIYGVSTSSYIEKSEFVRGLG